MKKIEGLEYGIALIFAGSIFIGYMVLGLIFSVMSGIGNLVSVLIYSAVSTFVVALLLAKNDFV